jgi:plasmid replication initiation protein
MKAKNNDLIVKTNVLNMLTFYKTSIQLKIFSKIITMIKKKPNDNFYEISVLDILNEFNLTNTNYTQIKQICKSMNQMIDISLKEEKGFDLNTLFYSINTKIQGYVSFEVNPRLKPYILFDKGVPYTSYYLENIVRLKSYYSIRIYELLKQFQGKDLGGWYKIKIEDLRERLGITQLQYTRYNDFKRKVILQAQKELAEKTDIKFTFEEIKKGRKIETILFHILPNKNILEQKPKEIILNIENIEPNKIEYNKEEYLNNPLYKRLKEELQLDNNFIKTIFAEYKEDRIKRTIEYTLNKINAGQVKSSIGGFFRSALKNDYASQTSITELKANNQKAIEEEHKQKELQEEKKIILLEKLKKDFENENQKKLYKYTDDNQKEIFNFYNDFKNRDSNKVFKFNKLDIKDLSNFIKGDRLVQSAIFRNAITEEFIKNKIDFIEFCKNKNINIIREYGAYKILD